jgi:arylsulfatase
MIEHDEQIGVLLKWLDDNNLADDTIVIYSTDNGNELMLWPDGGYAPFRGEKGTTWEGGVRVPMLARWPGKIPAGSACNGLQNHEDVYVTLAAAAGLTDVKEKLLQGTKLGDSEITYKVHLDGFNQLDMWTGKTKQSARKAHFYYDETELTAIRVGNWKMHIGVKKEGSWFNDRSYPSCPTCSTCAWTRWRRWILKATSGAISVASSWRGSCGHRMRAHPISPSISRACSLSAAPGADTLSMHKALESAMTKLQNPAASSN